MRGRRVGRKEEGGVWRGECGGGREGERRGERVGAMVGNHTGAGGVCPLYPPLLQEYGFCGKSNCSKSHDVIIAIQQKELQKPRGKEVSTTRTQLPLSLLTGPTPAC